MENLSSIPTLSVSYRKVRGSVLELKYQHSLALGTIFYSVTHALMEKETIAKY